jgi:amidase
VFYESQSEPGTTGRRGDLNPDQVRAMADAIDVLRQQGAVVVDPAVIPSVVEKNPAENFMAWNTCSGLFQGKGRDKDCSVTFKYGMKRDFNKWLASLGPMAPVKTLSELRAWNEAHRTAGALKYGQANLDVSDEMDVEADRARYEADRAKDIRLAATNGIDAAMKAQKLDALLFPGPGGAGIAARATYPTVIVPFALIPNEPTPSLPEGFDAKPQPFGVSFTGLACSEPRLLELAFAFEQATKRRVGPNLDARIDEF